MSFNRLIQGFYFFATASIVHAMVTVDFSHSYMGDTSPGQNTGQITLYFEVDDVGNVFLDASSSLGGPSAFVAEFGGSAGSIPNPALWSSSFQITIDGTGNLRIDNAGLGLSVQGGNPQRLDTADEAITFSLQSTHFFLEVSTVNYDNSNGSLLDINGVSFPISSGSGQVDASPISPAFSIIIDSSSDTDAEGFVLTGLSFDVIPRNYDSMQFGTDILLPVERIMQGSSDIFPFTGSDDGALIVGKAATIITIPSTNASPVAIGHAQLLIEEGARWILDGSEYEGDFAIDEQFILATFGSFSGPLSGIRHRNFDLPADRNLKLIRNANALYYKVVAQVPVTGPNIIIVCMDDMTAGHHFGFEGLDVLTPTIDSLAANGLNFTNAIVSTTVCSPSRYSLLTSRWPSRNDSEEFLSRFPTGTMARFGNMGVELPANKDNIAGWLQKLGYRTGIVGKSHIIDHNLLFTSNWAAGGLMNYSQTANPATNVSVNAAMAFNHRVFAQRHHVRGFDFAGGVYLGNLREQFNEYLDYHNQEWLTYYARQFIDENHAQPFFLYLAPTLIHGPIRSDLSRSLRADPRYTGEGYMPGLDYSFMPSRDSIIEQVTSAGKELESARETWVDYSIAAIVAKLEEHNILDNTFIIFTSDHGYMTLQDNPVLSGKASLFDSGLKVAMVMHWPSGITAPGRTFTGLVQNVDIAVTLLDIVGGTDLPHAPVDGVSLASILSGSNEPVRMEAYSEIGFAKSIRTLDHKLITLRYPQSIQQQIEEGFRWTNDNTGEATLLRPYYIGNSGLSYKPSILYPGYFDDDQLYDLKADPNEQNNTFGEEPETQVDLKKRLSSYRGSIPGRPFAEFTPIPSFSPSAPADFDWAIPSTQALRLDWRDTANNELGFFLAMAQEGGPYKIIAELPVDSSSFDLNLLDYGEDVSFLIFSYNAAGETPAAFPIDLIEPEIWRYRNFYDIDPTLSNPVSSWEADPTGDGFSNLEKYAFSMNPRIPEFIGRVQPDLESDESATFLRTYVPWDGRRKVSITGMLSTDLENWEQGEPFTSLEQDEFGHYFIRSNVPVESENNQFLFYRITLP